MDSGRTETEVGYALLRPRVKALLVDAILYFGTLVIFMLTLDLVSSTSGGRAALGIWLTSWLLYEPVLVSRYGGTVGHFSQNLRVVPDSGEGNLGFLAALWRSWVKALLGAASFIAIALTTRYQAIHDVASGSERAPFAIQELVRVSRPGGLIGISVMSLFGTLHWALRAVLTVTPEVNRHIPSGRQGELPNEISCLRPSFTRA